ncbi:hypothetical protein QTP99_05090 [Caldanaerobacter subterraneus KAk]
MIFNDGHECSRNSCCRNPPLWGWVKLNGPRARKWMLQVGLYAISNF